MIKKFVIVLKYLSLSALMLIGVLSCEKDFRNVGVDIVDNDVFTTDKYTSEIIAYSKNIERNQANALSKYLIGVHRDVVFGKLETSLVTQLSLVDTNPDFGTNAVIDTVIVDIPYFATLDGTQTDVDDNEVPKFVLDSVWTNGNKTFQLNIFELGTYLNTINPEDPTETKKYYSDDSFTKTNPSTPLYSNLIAPNPNDTMLVVKRYKYPNYPDVSSKDLYQTDSIKKTTLEPSLKIPFDNNSIKAIFQDNAAGSDFASNANFQHFFRGLYFEAIETNPNDAALMQLAMSNATMTIYYSNDFEVDEEEDQDLNGNGITGEENVAIRTPQSLVFPFSGVKSNLYLRDYTASDFQNIIGSIDPINGEEQLFIHGTAGSIALIKLFGEDDNANGIPDELEIIRTKNWLINDAKITLYIDQDYTTDWTPNRMYLYAVGEDEDTQLLDAMPQSMGSIGGVLEKDSEDEPEKYVFHITDYISELIKLDSEVSLYDLGIKVFDTYNIPNSQITTDTILKSYNTNPKGLVLKGNLPSSEENRIKLEIFYSEKN